MSNLIFKIIYLIKCLNVAIFAEQFNILVFDMKMDKVKKWGSKIFRRFSKVQLLSIGIIVVLAFFVGDSNIFSRIGNSFKISELQKQIKYYKEETQTSKEKLVELSSSKDNIEKFARETYLMKKADEDVFIIK